MYKIEFSDEQMMKLEKAVEFANQTLESGETNNFIKLDELKSEFFWLLAAKIGNIPF